MITEINLQQYYLMKNEIENVFGSVSSGDNAHAQKIYDEIHTQIDTHTHDYTKVTYTQQVASNASGAYPIGKIKVDNTETIIYGKDTDTTYGDASATAKGLMSKEHFSKLQNLDASTLSFSANSQTWGNDVSTVNTVSNALNSLKSCCTSSSNSITSITSTLNNKISKTTNDVGFLKSNGNTLGFLTSNDYNPNINTYITLTYTGASSQQITLKCNIGRFVNSNNNSEIGTSVTLTTNSNGIATAKYECTEWGLVTFSINNIPMLQAHVIGWKYAYARSAYGYVRYNDTMVELNLTTPSHTFVGPNWTVLGHWQFQDRTDYNAYIPPNGVYQPANYGIILRTFIATSDSSSDDVSWKKGDLLIQGYCQNGSKTFTDGQSFNFYMTYPKNVE